MFLKHLIITNCDGLIRRIDFRMGVNLIVDQTPSGTSDTGNNVGKTTLLRLIDYCLGGDAKDIYTSTENGVNNVVKDFLKNTYVVIELCLVDTFNEPDLRKVVIRRDFRSGIKALREVDGQNVAEKDFKNTLQQAIMGIVTDRPSFRQIISHSFRLDEQRLDNALRTITKYASGHEYEALHLFMFGANLDSTARKVALTEIVDTDRAFKNRLEKKASLSVLRSSLGVVENQIKELEAQKEAFNLNPDFEKELNELAVIKQKLSQLAVLQSNLNLRKHLILEAAGELRGMQSDANVQEVADIYQQAQALYPDIQHSFEELLQFHNEMLVRKANFISEELPELETQILKMNEDIATCRAEELRLEKKLNLSVTFEQFDKRISNLNALYQQRGELEATIKQIQEVEEKIKSNEAIIYGIGKDLYSQEHQNLLQKQLDKFNLHFSTISKKVYRERYAIGFDISSNKGKSYYKFSVFATDNFSTGKKQGEIVCFDLAYVTFADEEKIPCLHFILNDKKELLHGNQLMSIAEQAEEQGNVQYVAGMLSDKLPSEMDSSRYTILTLSQEDRLFRIEQNPHH